MAEPISTATVMAVTAIAKTASDLWTHFKQKDINKEAAQKLEGQKSDLMSGLIGVGQGFQGSMEMTADRKETDLKQLTETTETKLDELKDDTRNRRLTLTSTGSDTKSLLSAESNMWNQFLQGKQDINRKTEDAKIDAYSRLSSGASRINSEYDSLIGKIKSLKDG